MSRLVEQICHKYPQYPELKQLHDRTWRLNNLYSIRIPNGQKVPFRLNWAQKEILDDIHNFELVLKCRQIGMTTFFSLLELDQVLWIDNTQVGIIAQTLEDASDIFRKKLKFAFEHLDPRIRPFFKPLGDSATELAFSNGSSIRVATSLRSATLQFLHVSEFGKICAKDPEKAREIITGSLNTIHTGQSIFIESTAEGKEGYFYDMCQLAETRVGQELGPLDFKFRFFPWYRHPEYMLMTPVTISEVLEEYFAKVESRGVILTPQQKFWYAKKYELQRDDMFREYPTFSDEAFAASSEGYWYSTDMRKVAEAGRICDVSWDKSLPVHTAWDLGQGDFQVVWFFQVSPSGEIRCIDYFQSKNFDLNQTVAMLAAKGYTYGDHFWPHDANQRDKAGITFVQQAAGLNLHGQVLERAYKVDQIRLVRTTFSKTWFDKKKCKEGILCLENYKKKWSASIGGWTSEPQHDDASHGADAFAYLCQAAPRVLSTGSLESDAKALRNYWGG